MWIDYFVDCFIYIDGEGVKRQFVAGWAPYQQVKRVKRMRLLRGMFQPKIQFIIQAFKWSSPRLKLPC